MKRNATFFPPASKRQAQYEKQLTKQLGEDARKHIEQSNKRMKQWSQSRIQQVQAELDTVLKDLVVQIQNGAEVNHPEVQALISKHYHWVCHFWTPDRITYVGLAKTYLEYSDFRKFYETYHVDLVDFLAKAMEHYAESNLKVP